ncbi:MAG: hypothetical protein PHS86_08825 [Syntrophaceae bacterium]|nr:hypothetical protein [Syntrophaceae bacterium]
MSEKKEIKIEFVKAEGYKTMSATGCYGGISPQGEIVAEFFVDKPITPEETKLIVELGKTTEQKMDFPPGILREIQASFVIRPDLALSIGKWLIDKAEKAGGMKK